MEALRLDILNSFVKPFVLFFIIPCVEQDENRISQFVISYYDKETSEINNDKTRDKTDFDEL